MTPIDKLIEAAKGAVATIDAVLPHVEVICMDKEGVVRNLQEAVERLGEAIADAEAYRKAGGARDCTLETWLAKQKSWSSVTFGHGLRTGGLIDHIQKELAEIRANPHDLEELIDVIILALDGYWRHGGEPNSIMDGLIAKWEKNFARQWPTPTSEDIAVEHVRETPAKPKHKFHIHTEACKRDGGPLHGYREICDHETERRKNERRTIIGAAYHEMVENDDCRRRTDRRKAKGE